MSAGLADNVRKLRRTTGLSQEGLAEAADLSLSTVRKVEQGGHVTMETGLISRAFNPDEVARRGLAYLKSIEATLG